MYYYAYVLFCRSSTKNRGKFYVGYTQDLKKRVARHRSKGIKTTKNFDKVELVYYEACLNKTDARRRENQLKTGFGRGYIKRRIESYFKTLRD